ncbi:MAG TPA: serine/threonine-protein kinase, partial [Ktedonobacteraceae bacterium]|nr:serine/threonine-protein kinase [Ktedonobacteraceae bacterium]
MAISYFCEHCGAENAPGETACCACQYPLTQHADLLDANTLLNERYEVLSEIGAGGFGAVYQARDTQKSNQLVAVKQINLKGLSSQEIIEATDAFNREAEILSTLSHPLLPRIFDRFSDPEHWYLVMTFIDGSTLDEYLQQHMVSSLPASAGLPLSETLAIALQLCDVLHYLHSQQPPVIFRDLKPGNIMRTRGGRLYLIDFGIARRFKPGQAKDTIPFGSPGFAAPEQYGRAQTTPQADIYSLGALLSCLISGDDPSEHPFEFPPLRHNGIAGMHELDVLIWRMVALDATKRPADILDVQAELQRIQKIHDQANKWGPIWTPPPGQTPPPSGNGQQHLFLNQTSSAQTPRKSKTTRRAVLTVGLILGGIALVEGIADLGMWHPAQPVSSDINSGNLNLPTADTQGQTPTPGAQNTGS